jgi:DNA repair protein RecO (recombination protein O)
MNQLVTDGIVLARTNYGEADRIIKLLTPDHGKISLLARGVRKPKSKLAGGIELFSVSSITYIEGKGSIGTLISTRLEEHFGAIIKYIDRVQLGYELIKVLDRATEDQTESDYFAMLRATFVALNDPMIDLKLIRFWFNAQLIGLSGHVPNLQTDAAGRSLNPGQTYIFDFDSVAFAPHAAGKFTANHIKFLRLTFAGHPPATLQQVQGGPQLLPTVTPLVQTMLTSYIRV